MNIRLLYKNGGWWVAVGLMVFGGHAALQAVTLVYNLRVRRTFSTPSILKQMKSRVLFTAVPIFYARKSHIVDDIKHIDVFEIRKAGGSLFNLRYVPNKHWWLDITTGLETDHGRFTGSDPFHASRTGFDDIVFSAGYRYFVGHLQLVAYGIGGIPTRRSVDLEDRYGPLVGTRFYNLGFGSELSYSFLENAKRGCSAVVQQRFIHAFNRSWAPILPPGSTIQPGNFTDLLFVLQWREKFTMIDAGYNATWFTHQAVILPTTTTKVDTWLRNSAFVTVSHGWLDGLWHKPCIAGIGLNGGITKKFDAKTATVWVYGTIVF